MISVNIRQTTVTMLTPPQLQGRVSAVEWVFISASNELGAFESGAVASLVGAVPAVVAGGVVMIGIAAIWTKALPGARAPRPARGSPPSLRACVGSHAWSRSTAPTIWPYDERGEPREFYYSRYGSPTVADAEARARRARGRRGSALPVRAAARRRRSSCRC